MSVKYYNYIAFYRGIPVYVGKGSNNRIFHTINGRSDNEALNEFYFRHKLLGDMPLDTYKVRNFKEEVLAYKNEKKLIKKYLPCCNGCANYDYTDEYDFKNKLVGVSKNLGYTKPEGIMSNLDFRFLFTPKGLLCNDINIAENSPFEKVDFGRCIRIKEPICTSFPEYGLQFYIHKNSKMDSFKMYSTKERVIQHLEMGRNIFSGLTEDRLWILKSVEMGSFDFAKDFGFELEGIDHSKLGDFWGVKDSHVNCYEDHLGKERQKEMKILRAETAQQDKIGNLIKAVRLAEGAISEKQELYIKENLNRVIRLRKSNKFKVENTPKVLGILGINTYENSKYILIDYKKGIKFGNYHPSGFTKIKEEDLFLLDLNKHLQTQT